MSGSAKGDPTRVEGARPATTTPGPAAMNGSGHSVGSNAEDAPAGAETERDAPGSSKDDRADGLR